MDIIQYLADGPFDAMTIVDARRASSTYADPEAFFGLKLGEGTASPTNKSCEHPPSRGRHDRKAEVGAIQRMQGAERVVSRVPIKRNGGCS